MMCGNESSRTACYIHYNPVKHGYVTRIEDWPFSSSHHYLQAKGQDWLMDAFQRYPVIEFQHDDF
jgi:REP-associated tyrosine transposase